MKALNDNHILLVHPLGYPAAAAQKDIARMANLMPPIGLASIAAYLQTQGLDCAIIDCFARPDSDHLIKEYLSAQRPAYIGLSCTTSSFLDGSRIAKTAKTILPGIKTIFGGPHVSALKEKVLNDFSEVDFAVVGEGEHTLAELMKSGPEAYSATRGLVYRNSDAIIQFTGYREGIDLDSLPFPAYEKLEGVNLFDRMSFSYQQENKVYTVAREEFARLYQEGQINDDTMVFDTLVNTKGALENSWLKPLAKSWHHRMV